MLADKGIDTLSKLQEYDAETVLDILEYYQIQQAIQEVMMKERD